MSTTSGQFLTVPPLNHRSSQHRRRDSARVGAQPPRTHDPTTSRVASSSRVRLEDTPLGIPGPAAAAPSSTPKVDNDTDTTTTTSTTTATTTSTTVRTSSSSSSSSPSPRASPLTPPPQRQMQQTPPTPPTTLPPSLPKGPTAAAAGARSQSPPLSPRSLFRAVSFLLRLRSPPSADALSMTCSSGARRTHAVLSKSPRTVKKAAQPLTYSRTLVCADAVNAEVLLRLARNELLDRAQQASRHFTALVDEEWRYSIRQTKSGDYTVEVFYSACPAQCGGDPRKPIALSHVTNLPGLMRVVHSE
ncbi:hypothetical protein BC826DRAFT_968335 [Russula brevipes]|nr:hypothetical protein BC826DRAFT_968335 [Russula brevipes]